MKPPALERPPWPASLYLVLVPLLRWACLVNLPFGLVSVVAMIARWCEELATLGPELSQALAAVSRRPPETELAELWLEHHMMVRGCALAYAACILLLGAIAL